MPEFTFFEVHFHEFNPTNTAPLLGRGGSAREVARGESADPDLDGVPVEEAEPGSASESGTEESSGGPGAGLVVALVLIAALAVAARKFLGDNEELAELQELDDVA